MEKIPCVYILARSKNGTLSIGVTSNLPKRMWEHKEEIVGGFSKKYSIKNLVYYEVFEDMLEAIDRTCSLIP